MPTSVGWCPESARIVLRWMLRQRVTRRSPRSLHSSGRNISLVYEAMAFDTELKVVLDSLLHVLRSCLNSGQVIDERTAARSLPVGGRYDDQRTAGSGQDASPCRPPDGHVAHFKQSARENHAGRPSRHASTATLASHPRTWLTTKSAS